MSPEQIAWHLKRPFDPKRLHWRLGATNAKKNGGRASRGIALGYVDARDVMKRLEDVVGPFGWQTYLHEVAGTCACALTLMIDNTPITRTDTADKTDVEGSKGAASVALRRAAAQFGVGRYLYMLPNTWVEVDERGQFQPPALPDWATPDGYAKRVEYPE